MTRDIPKICLLVTALCFGIFMACALFDVWAIHSPVISGAVAALQLITAVIGGAAGGIGYWELYRDYRITR
jgi:hypothetical protein